VVNNPQQKLTNVENLTTPKRDEGRKETEGANATMVDGSFNSVN